MGNIACFIPGCREHVIGQCPGYKEGCGRFYCAKHSSGNLCAAHAQRLVDDQKTQQLEEEKRQTFARYQELAKQVRSKQRDEYFRRPLLGTWKAWLKGAVMGAIIGPLWYLAVSPQNTKLTLGLAIVCALLGGLVISFVAGVLSKMSIVRQRTEARVMQLNETQPQFADFYREWRKQKSRDAMGTALTIIGLVAAASLAAAASSSEDTRTRRAVDEELKKHGL